MSETEQMPGRVRVGFGEPAGDPVLWGGGASRSGGIHQSAQLREIYLKPGELLIMRKPCLVTTVLGSCVTVTMFSARLHFAAICHGMLSKPTQPLGGTATEADGAARFKYLSEAIPFMASRFRLAGLVAKEIEVKIFGGGNVLGYAEKEHSSPLVGTANIEAARKLLLAESVVIKSGSVGGRTGRKILFNSLTGEVMHRHL